MHPNGSDDILFRGIPRPANRRSARFLTSLLVHVGGAALVLTVVPRLVIPERSLRYSTTLIAPDLTPPPPPPKPAPPVVAIQKTPPPPALRPAPRVAEVRVAVPKLEEAPRLANTPRLPPVLPAPVAVIRPAIETGVFGANAPAQAEPKLPVPAARDAGFESSATNAPAAPAPVIASAGFDARSADSRAVAAAKIQTGAFGQVTETRAPRGVAATVAHPGFDLVAEAEKPAAPDQIHKTGFDQPKVVGAPVKRLAPASAPVRALEILDKPKPVYTAEARSQKIEGTVLLDVVFTANGEVRVLGVVRGLGHGLDENAIDAARRIRFTPALQSGTPVDQHVTLHVVFQITG
jgi:TonB family protein